MAIFLDEPAEGWKVDTVIILIIFLANWGVVWSEISVSQIPNIHFTVIEGERKSELESGNSEFSITTYMS